MKKIIHLAIISLLLLSGSFLFFKNNASAAELNFAVETVIPENQIDKKKSYFELKMTPGQEQTLEVVLRNDTEKEIIVEPKINSAFTNINGVVEYGESDKELDKSLLYNLKDLITVDESVTIPAQSSITVSLKVKMPPEAYKGILAGGITFKEKKSEEESTTTQEDNNLAIKNEYAYVVGIVLSESDEAVKPELALNQVVADQVNARNAIKANLQNITPTFVNQLKVTTEISKKGSKDVLYRTTKEAMQMAPNSNFDFPTMLEGEKLAAGTYVLNMDASSGENTWHFEQEFTIDADEAKELNKSDVTIHEDYTWLYILLSALGGMLLMLALYLIFKRKK
ncbi:DUF916 and DUF3324 domain-containing protein [Isobaculum melis]|uniref:Uncharacterized protein n=1 Tax=Isobaculum melis TaxID=142588 RepID=A0A1H9UGF5_9LACT|nr:DUF916 and DUF3324 domain-containing protein [Isobaculum melis]SES08264.1 protein of unknown function [Isobaculum melis]